MNTEIFQRQITLENKRVLLLPFDHTRNKELFEIAFESEIWKYMGMSITKQTDLEEYIRNTIRDKQKGLCYPFLIVDKPTNRVAGSTRYGYLNPISKKCEIGWTWLGKDFQGTGLNKASKFELLTCGFETIGFRRIQFSADQENVRSQKAIQKLGATQEGIFRNNYIAPNGESRDDVYFSIIREEWNELKEQHFKEFLS